MRRYLPSLALALLAALGSPQAATAGDAFFKGGFLFHPDVGGIRDSWFVSVGSDWGVAPVGFVGVEFQTAYHSYPTVSVIPANLLVNGKWKSEAERFRPYAGGGFGLVSAVVRTKLAGTTDTSYQRRAGLQLVGGVEFNRKFLVELSALRAFVNGAEFGWSIAGGVRF